MSENKELVVQNLSDIIPSENITIEDLLEDAQGIQLQFDKITIPTAGNIAFTITDPESGEEEPKKSLRGIILSAKPSNVYYEDSFNGEKVSPTCSSKDGYIGIDIDGEQHDCASCEMNQFGSGRDGKGKACQNRMNIYILLDGESVPRQMSLPASALANFNQFRTQLVMSKRMLRSVFTIIKLEKKKSKSGIEYSCPTFSIDGSVMSVDEKRSEEIKAAWSLLKCAQIVQ